MSDSTEREMKMMACAWQCFEEQPKINFDKLAGLVGMTNPRSATNAWANIKKKLAAQAGDDEGAASTPKTPKSKAKATPKKRGKKASDEDDEEEVETPAAKKPRSARKASAAPKSYNEESAEERDEDAEAGATVKAEEDGQDFLA